MATSNDLHENQKYHYKYVDKGEVRKCARKIGKQTYPFSCGGWVASRNWAHDIFYMVCLCRLLVGLCCIEL